MKIEPKHTVADIINSQGALFNIGMGQISARINEMPPVEYVCLKRKLLPDKVIRVRNTDGITLGELDVLNARSGKEDYFYNTLGVMLGFIRFRKRLPDGKPDWVEGWDIDRKSINNLGFARAFRYFLQLQPEIDNIAKVWAKLGAWKKKSGTKRPNRGLVSICRQYCCLVEGAVKPADVWNLPWPMVYEAFENCDFDNREQAKAYDAAKQRKNGRS